MKNFIKNNFHILGILVFFALPVVVYASYGDVGFWSGVWHGLTFPFRILLKFVWTDITIYDQFDSNYWYHVGYSLGLLTIFGGGASQA